MARQTRIANWGAIQGETGPATTQVLRRILGAGGDGRGGVLESAVMNVFRTTNVYGGEAVPPRSFIGPPPQIIIGFNDATVWNHGVQADADYHFYRSGVVHFKLTSDGRVSIQNPATDGAWLNIQNPIVDESTIQTLNPTIWLDANDPIGDGTDPSSIADATDIESLTGGHWADKGTGARHVTSSFSAGSQPVWYKATGASPAPSSLPNGKPCVSTIPGGVGTDNFAAFSSNTFTIFAVLLASGNSSKVIGSQATSGPGNNASQVVMQSTTGDPGGWASLFYEIGTPPSATGWSWSLGATSGGWKMASWDSTGAHKHDGAASTLQQTEGTPGGALTLVLEEYFQRTINTGSIQRTVNWFAEVLVFDYVLTAAQYAIVEAYLRIKYDVAGGIEVTGGGAPMIHGYNAGGGVSFEFDEQGRLHLGGEDPVTALTITDSSEQARIRYDASNYASFTVDATGNLTLDLEGTSPEFFFADSVNISGELAVTSTNDAQARIAYDANSYLDLGMVDTAAYIAATASDAYGDGTRIFSYSPIWIRQDFGGGPLTGPAGSGAEDLVITTSDDEGGGDVGISLICGDLTSIGRINFGDNAANAQGGVAYSHSNDTMYLIAGGTDAMYANASHVLLNKGDLNFVSATTGSRIYVLGNHLIIEPDIDSVGGALKINNYTEIVNANISKPGLKITTPAGATDILTLFGDGGANECFMVDDNGDVFGYDGTSEMRFVSRTDDDGLTPHDSFHFVAGNGNPFGKHTEWKDVGTVILDLPHGGGLRHLGSGATAYMYEGGTWNMPTGAITFADNVKTLFGDAGDASIYFNGSALIIDPKEVGSGGTLHTGAFWVYEAADAADLHLYSGNDSTGNIFFGDSGDSDVGRIVYDHTANTLTFSTSAVAEFSVGTDLVTIGVGSGSSLRFEELAVPSTPATSQALVFLDSADGELKIKKDTGTVVALEGGGAGGSGDSFLEWAGL